MRANKFKYKNLSNCNKVARMIWNFVWLIFYRPTPYSMHFWRCFLLRLFGAKIGKNVHPYPSSRIWAPWNLSMDDNSCLSNNVDCYCVDKIRIGKFSTVSQYSFLCTASHDYSKRGMPLVISEINIGENVWITADVFIGPGVNIGNGSIILARSTVLGNIPEWVVARGNPAIAFKKRIFE